MHIERHFSNLGWGHFVPHHVVIMWSSAKTSKVHPGVAWRRLESQEQKEAYQCSDLCDFNKENTLSLSTAGPSRVAQSIRYQGRKLSTPESIGSEAKR